MFCGKCGAKVADNAAFCGMCGARLNAAPVTAAAPVPPAAPAPKAPVDPAGKRNRAVGIIAVAVAAVLVLALVITAGVLLFGGGCESTVNTFLEGVMEPDGSKVLKALPKEDVEIMLEESGCEDRNELAEYLEENIEESFGYIELIYGDFEITWDILDARDVSRRDLKDIQAAYEDELDVKVSAAKEVEVELTARYGKEEEDKNVTFVVIKIGSSWYMDIDSMDSLF